MSNPSGIESARAFKMAELTEYSPGAVVSRTLYKGVSGTLTAFAFDEGQELSPHSAPFDAYVVVTEGEVELMVGEETLKATAGEMVLMPKDVPHALKATTRFKMLLIMMREQ